MDQAKLIELHRNACHGPNGPVERTHEPTH